MTIEEEKARVILGVRRYTIKEEKKEGESTILLATKRGDKLLVFCTGPGVSTVGINTLKSVQRRMETEKANRGMIVSEASFSFSAKNFAFNLMEHELIPKQRILTKDEVDELLKRYRIRPYQIPHIKATDPVAILLGAKLGDIIEITRDSPTAGKALSYRFVVE
ncbi:MAG: DNA-directed RNA polymerase subunit H [Candidatus Bathyarchaeia archaeon]